MAKRIKPKNLLDGSSNEIEKPIASGKDNSSKDSIAVDASQESSLIGAKITAAEKEKLEKYDALEKTVLELTSKNEMLEAKVAEYIEKLSNVDASNDEIAKLKDEIAELKKAKKSMPKNESKESASEIARLKKECKILRDEADGYLVKISELTFENANLTCQLEEANKKLSSRNSASNASSSRNLKPTTKTRVYKNNGYDSWN